MPDEPTRVDLDDDELAAVIDGLELLIEKFVPGGYQPNQWADVLRGAARLSHRLTAPEHDDE